MIKVFHILPIVYLGRLWNQTWLFRHKWFCQIFHWRYRHPTFGGYGFGGRTDLQTAIHCSKCHTSRSVCGWQKAVVVKTDAQITTEIDTYGREQLTPEEYWRNGKWAAKKLTNSLKGSMDCSS